MEKKSNLLLSFLIGAAAGAAIAYLLSNGKGEEIEKDIKETAGKIKDELEKQYEKGKALVEDLKQKADETLGGNNPV